MTSNTSRLKQTLQNLILACINATLLLVFLCLLITFFIFQKVEDISESFAQNLVPISPLIDEVSALNMTMIGLKEDIELLKEAPEVNGSASLYQVQARLDKIQSGIDEFNESVGNISNAPTKLIDHTIEKVALELKAGFNETRSCSRSKATEPFSETVSN